MPSFLSSSARAVRTSANLCDLHSNGILTFFHKFHNTLRSLRAFQYRNLKASRRECNVSGKLWLYSAVIPKEIYGLKIAVQITFALVACLCQASAESLGQSVKNSYPVFGHGTRNRRVPPSKKGGEGHGYPIDLATTPPITFFFVSLLKGHALCEQGKSRCFHRPVWLFDFPEENCPSTGTGKRKIQ